MTLFKNLVCLYIHYNVFFVQGLYKFDEREGPGILSYPDDTQDVGLWHREKLVKLCTAVPGAFSMQDHPEFDYFPEEHTKQVIGEVKKNKKDVIDKIINPPDEYNYPPHVDITEKAEAIFDDSLNPESIALCVQPFEDEFFKDVADKIKDLKNSEEPIHAWNHTLSSIAMQKHVLRHKCRQDTAKFDVDKVIKGDREGFSDKGPVEKASEELLKSAVGDDLETMMCLINSGQVHPDVCDKQGHTALLGAAVSIGK